MAQLDNDLAGTPDHELFAPGWLSGAEVFERVLTGLATSTVDDPARAWSRFSAHTRRRIERSGTGDGGHSSIDGMVPVYRRALRLVPEGRALDVGSCFGFLALLMAGRAGNDVVFSDIAGGTVGQVRGAARTLICDGVRIPLRTRPSTP